MNGYVHIVESPASTDLLDGRTEGRVLSEALSLAQIPYWYSLASDPATLNLSLGPRLVQAVQHHGRLPIMHFSMHGNQDGIVLTNQAFITWHELRNLLLPLNRALEGGLLICMSSCFGTSGCRMAMYSDDEPPFWALVGHPGSATWADAAIAYASFYHQFFKATPLKNCIEAMKAASGDQEFTVHSGQATREGWLAYVQQVPSLSDVQNAAEAMGRGGTP